LVALAQILQGALGPAHLLTRLDEDLFGILARVDSRGAARDLAEFVRATVEAANLRPIEGGLDLTISIGVALLTEGEEPMRRVALALAEAKRLGRNRVVLADEVGESSQPAQVVLLLQEALSGSGGFQLHLQPIERLASGEREFYEVLLRLAEPGGGLLLPGQFLEAAAQYHLMPHVDRWVVTEAFRLLVGRPQLRLFVNLSGQGLNSLALLESIEAMVLAAGPDVAGRLVFEITETSAVRDLGRARQWMTRLTGLGVRFALDDFGSGFASFEYLAALPVQFVKLSGLFVRNLDTDPRHRVMVEAVTAVAHALEKRVIAEWVESRAVAGLLTTMGVEFGQGFALGRPVPVAE
jgi:EAL domain-containing protein (putative c-di-GMP-specific phosphodiesterase class I)